MHRITRRPHILLCITTLTLGLSSCKDSKNAGGNDFTPPSPPVITDPENGASTADTTPTFSGIAEPGSTVQIYEGTTELASTVAGDDGMWSTELASLTEGDHNLIATATDAAGNVSDPSAELAISVDLTAPAPPIITAPTNGTTITSPGLTVSGSAEVGTIVEVRDGTEVVGNGVVTTIGWSVDIATLMEGPHTLSAVAIDRAGNQSPASTPVTITVAIGYPLEGTVSGLVGLVQLTDGSETLTVATDGNVAFSAPVSDGGSYSVIIAAQPATQTCTAQNASGTASGSVPAFTIACTTDVTDVYEDNDTVGSPFVASLDTLYGNAWLSSPHDPVDVQLFSLVDDMTTVLWDVTGTLTITSNPTGAEVDVSLSLISPSGIEIYREDITLSGTGSGAVTFPLRSAGGGEDYAFVVTTADPDADLLYSFELTRAATTLPIADCGLFADSFEPNDTPGEAAALALDTTYVATHCEPDDVADYYAFTVPPGGPQRVTATVTYLNNEGSGSVGFEGYAGIGSGGAVGGTTALDFTFNPGDYVFSQSFSGTGEPLTYQLELVTSAPCMDDSADLPPNDDDFPAGALAASAGSYMATGCRRDPDYRTITMEAGDTLNITADTASHQFMGVRIFGITGLVCDNQSGAGPVTASCYAEFDGDYDFEVTNSQSDEDYTVDVEVVDGPAPGDPNLMFVTSSTVNLGTLGSDLSGADAFCNSVAAAANGGAGLPGTYVAWLSTSVTSAVDRLAGSRGWVRTDGRAFADTASNVNTNRLFYPPNVDENGNIVTKGTFAATGADGSDTCGDWQVSNGLADAGATWSANWQSYTSVSCAGARLYCFGVGQDVPVAPPPATGRIAFISTSILTLTDATDNLAAADALCQSNASTAMLSGTFLALMAGDGTNAVSRFSAGEPWKRIDNVLLTDTANDFLTGGDLLAPLVTGPGAQSPKINNGVWTGATSRTQNGTSASTCSDWMSTGGTAAISGRSGFNDENFFDDFLSANCDAGNNFVYCLEQ